MIIIGEIVNKSGFDIFVGKIKIFISYRIGDVKRIKVCLAVTRGKYQAFFIEYAGFV